MLSHLVSILLMLCLPAAALADGLDCYGDGNAAMKAGDFAAAAEHYATARADPACEQTNDGLLYNEAVALERLAGDPDPAEDEAAPACRALEAMREASAVARDDTRGAIADAIARLESRCPPPGSLTIECVPAGGTVLLPMLSGPRACPARFPEVRPGRYAGEVVAAGRSVPFDVEVISGQPTVHRVELRIPPPDPLPPPSPPPPPPPPPGLDLSPYGWSAVGLGLIAGGIASYAYIDSLDAIDEAEQAMAADDRPRFDVAIDQHQTLEKVHLGSVIGAGVMLVAGVALLWLDDDAPVEAVVGPASGVVVRWGP